MAFGEGGLSFHILGLTRALCGFVLATCLFELALALLIRSLQAFPLSVDRLVYTLLETLLLVTELLLNDHQLVLFL